MSHTSERLTRVPLLRVPNIQKSSSSFFAKVTFEISYTRSQTIYGSLVETCEPYSHSYTSKLLNYKDRIDYSIKYCMCELIFRTKFARGFQTFVFSVFNNLYVVFFP